MPRVFLIDGSSQMYRAYHAIRGLTAPDGRSTNAIYGFVTMLRKLIADHQPDYIAASFDLAGPTFRDELSATYKATRAPMPTGPRRGWPRRAHTQPRHRPRTRMWRAGRSRSTFCARACSNSSTVSCASAVSALDGASAACTALTIAGFTRLLV